jgi:hypothetical protein
MSFRFRKRIKIVPGFAINLSKGGPSLTIGGHGATMNLSRGGSRTTLGIPGTGMSWQFGGHRHIHKAVQVQADIKSVHAQGTIKAVQAQADIIAITKRMETVAKRLTRNAVGNTYWKKAAFEQARLLDKMLEVAKASENEQLIKAVRKCHNAWGDGNPHYRAALDSGMTITDCLAMVLAGRQPDQHVAANLLNHSGTPANNVDKPAAKESSANREQLVLEEKHVEEPSIDETALLPDFPKTLGWSLILAMVGSGLIAVAYMIVAHKTTPHPQALVSARSVPEILVGTPIPQPTIPQPATPAPHPATPAPTPAQATPAPSPHEQTIHVKTAGKKHPIHNSTRRPER